MRRAERRGRAVTGAAAMAAAVLSCASVVAQTERPADAEIVIAQDEPREIAWPERAARVVRPLEVGPWTLYRVGPWDLGRSAGDEAASGLVAAILEVDPETIQLEKSGSIVVAMPEGELLPTAGLAGKPAAACEVVSAKALADGAHELERTAFVLYNPSDPAGEDSDAERPDGLVVLLPGMFGTPEPVIDSVVGQLRGRGWHVLRMLTHSSRFTQRAEFVVVPGGEVETVAAQVAGVLGDRAAECAFAVEAACGFFAKSSPGLPVQRRVALGMSGGGMILPTVVAREHDAYKAAVFVGAGCDFAAIAMDSNYTDWIDAVRVTWQEEPTANDRAAFTEAYLAAAELDSYHTALAMTDIPTLMLHGMADRAVPAATGDLLWNRLGEPERWTVPAGHEVLFLAYLPSRAADMLDWIEQAVVPTPAPIP
ncbi:MAG: prolyl oligopeptidase family serine peptidase [Planctomycetota bacterium]|nr:MAG: prolyl oligopeptidase family serine peptidase [Planctomycetota bacterium]